MYRGFDVLGVLFPFIYTVIYKPKGTSGCQGELMGKFNCHCLVLTSVLSCCKNRGRSIPITLYWGRSFTPKRRKVGKESVPPPPPRMQYRFLTELITFSSVMFAACALSCPLPYG